MKFEKSNFTLGQKIYCCKASSERPEEGEVIKIISEHLALVRLTSEEILLSSEMYFGGLRSKTEVGAEWVYFRTVAPACAWLGISTAEVRQYHLPYAG